MNPYDAPNGEDSSCTLDEKQFRHLLAEVSAPQLKVIAAFAAIASAFTVLAWAVFLAKHINERFQPNMGFWIIPHFGLAVLMSFAVGPVTYFSARILRRRVVRPCYVLGIFPCLLLVSPCIRLVDYTIVRQWDFIAAAIVFAGVFSAPAIFAGLVLAGLLSMVMMLFGQHESGEP
ncbi:hypothetical protein [Rhodopirellula europaea]|uniref:hypothetical protein n=1 Tax=Rhodopirellula europaea TaxID=1263866 RepID=UPI00055DAA26|nr:hypothetical protein [Rhodopirellula europaea]